jgi:hypothetical protein
VSKLAIDEGYVGVCEDNNVRRADHVVLWRRGEVRAGFGGETCGKNSTLKI